MSSLLKNKSIIALLVISVLLMAGYHYYAPVPATESGESATVIGSDLLDLSAKLSKVQLDPKLFNERAYLFLSDFSIALPQQSFGRKNPFGIIGRE